MEELLRLLFPLIPLLTREAAVVVTSYSDVHHLNSFVSINSTSHKRSGTHYFKPLRRPMSRRHLRRGRNQRLFPQKKQRIKTLELLCRGISAGLTKESAFAAYALPRRRGTAKT